MERFADEVTEEIYWTRFAPHLDQHLSVKAHKILRPLVAARGLQDVGIFGPILRFKNAPRRLGVEVEGKWHLTLFGSRGRGHSKSNSRGTDRVEGRCMTIQQSRYVPAPPVAPGEVLRDQILGPLGITQDKLASALQVSRFSVNQIINGRRAITAEMALRLAQVTSTTAQFWLNLQRDVDVYQAHLKLRKVLPTLNVLRKPQSESELIVDFQGE